MSSGFEVNRIDYSGEGLDEATLASTPFAQASIWIEQAIARDAERGDVPEPMSMAVATVDAQGAPNVRTVLARIFDEHGPGFLTYLDSAKGQELAANPAIAVTFTWPAMFRAIRIRGRVVELPRTEVATYFASRPWGSRISAWASVQSAPATGRAELESTYAVLAERWPDQGSPDDVPVPPRWGGFRIIPDEVEFWGGRSNRLHDRLVFMRIREGSMADANAWSVARRQP